MVKFTSILNRKMPSGRNIWNRLVWSSFDLPMSRYCKTWTKFLVRLHIGWNSMVNLTPQPPLHFVERGRRTGADLMRKFDNPSLRSGWRQDTFSFGASPHPEPLSLSRGQAREELGFSPSLRSGEGAGGEVYLKVSCSQLRSGEGWRPQRDGVRWIQTEHCIQ